MLQREEQGEEPLPIRPAGVPPSCHRVREDALPENLDYADTGCEIADRCLACPLPRCRYDEPGGARQIFLRERDREIARLRGGDGVGIDELARRFGVSRRTVFRVLRRVTRQRRAS